MFKNQGVKGLPPPSPLSPECASIYFISLNLVERTSTLENVVSLVFQFRDSRKSFIGDNLLSFIQISIVEYPFSEFFIFFLN